MAGLPERWLGRIPVPHRAPEFSPIVLHRTMRARIRDVNKWPNRINIFHSS